jgi:protein tyrosine/serine phosphatase
MQTLRAYSFGSLIVLLMIAAPLAYTFWHEREFRNFRVVEEGVLYRCGQLTLPRLQQVALEHNIKTVISLRDGDKPIDEQEETWVKATRKMRFYRIPYRDWNPDSTGKIPAEVGLKAFREVMDDPSNYPVLVHCFAGIHRTGTMCAVFRMDYQGWTNEQAMTEMRAMGYTILDQHEDVHRYFLRYRPPFERKATLGLPVSRREL